MFEFDLLDITDNLEITKIGVKNIYNTDGKKNYLDEIKSKSIFKEDKVDVPQMYGSLNFRDKGNGVFYKDSLGYFVCEGDTVESNPSSVFIISGPSYRNRGVNINKTNFLYITSYFSARRSVDSNWTNQKDSYLFDETQIQDDNVYDTIVYSLFNNSSFQCSSSPIDYKGDNIKTKNEFFWLSSDFMKEIADKKSYDNLYNDARTSEQRYVYELLYGEKQYYNLLSDTAKNVLDKATELIVKSIEMRQVMEDEDNQLSCWDAGYSQLKYVWKEYFQDDYKIFRNLYKKLDEKMNLRVYDLNFLNK